MERTLILPKFALYSQTADKMNNTIKIKRGLDIPIGGAASTKLTVDSSTSLFAIEPDDYPGYTWKVCVKAGDKLQIGSSLLYAKEDESLRLTSPVAGDVKEIRRGERRKIEFISIEKSGDQSQISIKTDNDAENVLAALKTSGLFAYIRQRPFDIVASPLDRPRDIFVTGFDSAPLAPELLIDEVKQDVDNGLRVLAMLTDGDIYLSLRKGTEFTTNYAKVYYFDGPHPSGNVGTQIAAIKPVNKGETVWTTDIVTVSRIGKLIYRGIIDYKTIVALTGDEVKDPHLIETTVGASLKSMLKGQLKTEGKSVRIISGNVLTGIREHDDDTGFLRFPYRQITVIEEGDNADEFMGWASLDPGKFSVKRSFPAFLKGLNKPFKFDARVKGGRRAMIMSGEYDKVFPMDIYPEYLIKAIMAKDIDRMEKLGIYEVAPEDFALPEFVDTSKLELQKIVREGLEYLRKETV